MIRESIARHLGDSASAPAGSHQELAANAAFLRLPLVRGADDDGMCIIEPSVPCTHCGYCQSFGH